ncbi:hypothetical protein DUNSADRAFT_3821 [Dunaliella salina]|uniref:Uncharacterized protein n=1 Tax=Dunaliella salina TaxID=3046 RepID=A0ABQ7GT64_DUNSA|nr:hypothetical protein DUNSADRAFT_3821 [Dunaliella salina]|eukprot:KAF5837805.1 hypothetical protein DUNSADRAFT_3821 [Dunaliella salina]
MRTFHAVDVTGQEDDEGSDDDTPAVHNKILQTVKLHHVIDHAPADISAHGLAKNYSAQHLEKRHAPPKDEYARTNKQSTKALDQMVQLNAARLGYNHLMSITEEDRPEPEATQRRTAYMTASSSGINQLQVRGKTISLAMLSGDELLFNNMAKSVKQDTTTLLDSQPELKQLRDRLQQQLYSGTYDGGRNLPADLPASKPEKAASLRAMALSDIIPVLPGGCIVSCPSWGSESDPGALQVVRACPELYGCERYDFVSSQRPKRAVCSYAQLRLLFRADSAIASDDGAVATQDFALLHCFESAAHSASDKLAAAGCVRIKPDTRNNKPRYEVVPFSSILSQEFVVQRPNKANVYHVSCFLPN